MKNLKVIKTQDLNLESHIIGHCFELDRHLINALNDSGQLLKVPVGTTETYNQKRTLISIEQLKGIKAGCVRLIEYIVEASGILIVLKDGKLLLVSEDGESCDCIYTHHTEISSASLSPTQDFILIADEQNGLKLMPFPFSDGSQVYQSNALTHNKSLHKPVGVGWGSKETQFFGLDGRPSQEQTKQQKMTSSISNVSDQSITIQIESSDDFGAFLESRARKTSIAWKGDSQLIATLTAIPESNKHYLKVWNKRLELQYMSEQLVDIEKGLISYIPNGHFLCCAQRRDQQVNEVLLFEKNGLVRDRITLPPLKDVHIKAMSWSSDSSILAIVAKQFRYEGLKLYSTSLLFLYTMQNWHYYLKFTSRLSNDDYSISWHSNNITTLQIMSDSGHYIEYNCSSYVDYSLDLSTVAVLDANRVLITPLQCCAIPPPYSAIQLETSSPICALAIDYSDASNLVILTLDNKLILTSDYNSSFCCDAALKVLADEKVTNSQVKDLYHNYQKYTVYDFPDGQALQNLFILDKCTLVASRTSPTGTQVVLVLFTRKIPTILAKANFLSQRVLSISRYRKFSLLITLDGNSSVIWDPRTDKFKWINLSGEMNQNIFVVDSQILPSINSLITLSQDLCLRVDQKVILFNSCTSFRVTYDYLVFTTNENTLNFILLEKLNQQGEFESWSQTIENGGILITASDIDFKVVLQMPRGNLEVLHPRILIFSALTELIDERKYVQACKLARRHRVNMNFLVDYIMSLRCEYLNEFTLDILKYDPNLMCLIITELENLSTISGRYKDLMKHLPTRRKVNLELEKKRIETQCELDKVNRFCSSIKFPTDLKYLNPKLQSLLKMEPKRMTEALKIVYELDDESKVKALKFVLYFVDIDQLFLDALCTFDTNIALMVASASNKDPKQYLAFLDELNEIENDNFRFFTIDMHVKHYKEAFDHLLDYLQVAEHSDKVQAQLIDLVVSKRIYQHAIEVLEDRGQYDKLSELIWAKYANYLFEKRYYTEASVAFSKAQSYSSVTEYLSSASRITSLTDDWESLIALIARSKVENFLKENLLKKISDQLGDRGKFYESLVILDSSKFSLSDTLLSSMLNRGQWYLAEFIADQDSRSSVRMKVKNSVMDTFSDRITSWTDELNVAQKQLSKLKTLMLAARSRQFDTEGCHISDSLSTVDGSETSSLTSGSGVQKVTRSGITSIKTRSSIKSNKPQFKRITMKPGSRHEDIALILELQKFMNRQKPHQDEAITILAALYEYTPFNTARSSSTSMKNLLSNSLTFSQEASEELWPSSLNLDQEYSLYERVKDYKNYEVCENVDFEILIKPKLPKSLISFEL